MGAQPVHRNCQPSALGPCSSQAFPSPFLVLGKARSSAQLVTTRHLTNMQVDAHLAPPGITGRHRLDERCRSHNSEVAGSNPAPATKYGRFSRLLAYAQVADQHVWSAASVFMGTVCGDLLNPCVRSMGRVARTRADRALRLRNRVAVGARGCIGMPWACLCSCPTQSPSGFGRGDLDFRRDDDGQVEGNGGDADGGTGVAAGVGSVQVDDEL